MILIYKYIIFINFDEIEEATIYTYKSLYIYIFACNLLSMILIYNYIYIFACNLLSMILIYKYIYAYSLFLLMTIHIEWLEIQK